MELPNDSAYFCLFVILESFCFVGGGGGGVGKVETGVICSLPADIASKREFSNNMVSFQNL